VTDTGSRLDGELVALRDGSCVRIRPIAPEDRAELAAGFERLSPESRYRRFLSPLPRLSERALDYLTQVDHHDHEALVAADEGTGAGVGVARYVRTDGTRAEPAVAVADDWQGRGLGTVLLDALVDRARSEGISLFEATVLATNEPAISLLEGAGATTRTQAGHEVLIEVSLPEPPGAGARLAGLLRAVACGAVAPRGALVRGLDRQRGRPA
jgi:GNAT superfamily N-acetyltransferase